jgi:hypothetical protein
VLAGIVAVVMAVAFPVGAGAFVGESAVLNPAKTDLTGPAKTILTKPTFLPAAVEGAAAGGGVAEATASASVFQAGGLLPVLSSVLAFGAGTVIGSEICGVLGIEGCWYFHSDGADPADGVESYFWQATNGSSWMPFSWTWSRGKSGYETLFGIAAGCANKLPGGITKVRGPFGPPYNDCTKPTPLKVAEDAELWRHGMANRSLDYHATDDPGIPNYPWSPSESAVSAGMAGVLKAPGSFGGGGYETAEIERVGQHIASQIPGSGISDPYPHEVTVPSCSGEAWIGCKEQLEELELKPERKELDWSDAHLDLAPDEVVELDPAPGTKITVPTETKTIVTTNPDEAGMPVVVPAPLEGETYDDYIARLAPQLKPSRVTVSPEFTDPTTGPDGVIRTVPKSGTRANPETETEIDVQTNPSDAPTPSGTPWSAPAIPAIDLSPLAGVGIGCNDFPFGIFCWIGAGLTAWGPGGECPTVGVPFGSSVGIDDELAFDLCQFEPAMEVVRPVLILLSAFCLAYLFAAAAMGFGGSTGSED